MCRCRTGRKPEPESCRPLRRKDNFVFAGDRFGDELNNVIRNLETGQVDVVEFIERSECPGDVLGGDVAQFDQDIADGFVLLFGDARCFGQLFKANESTLEEEIGEISHRTIHAVVFQAANRKPESKEELQL